MRNLAFVILLVCLALQAEIFMEGASFIAAVFGHVDQPAAWAALIFFGTGAIEGLVIGLLFILDREEYGQTMNGHQGSVEDALRRFMSVDPDDHGKAQDTIGHEHERRTKIVRMGEWGYARGFFMWGLFFATVSGLVVLAQFQPS